MSNDAASLAIPPWIRDSKGIAFSDVPTRQGGRLPDFFIVGAAKAGTTALNDFLDQHPQIHMCPLKEPHFFSTDVMFAAASGSTGTRALRRRQAGPALRRSVHLLHAMAEHPAHPASGSTSSRPTPS